MPLILASASPRRAQLLSYAGFDFVVDAADVDETVHEGESASEYVVRVARSKAAVVAARHPSDETILAADTTVVVDGRILAKPEDAADAVSMLRLLSGRAHDVLTAVVVRRGSAIATELEHTVVSFAPLSDAEIAWYVASGEAEGKAGAYGIQGRAARFVTRIEGSWSNVVGLPVATVYRLLTGLGA